LTPPDNWPAWCKDLLTLDQLIYEICYYYYDISQDSWFKGSTAESGSCAEELLELVDTKKELQSKGK
jgi:hypothetical protein